MESDIKDAKPIDSLAELASDARENITPAVAIAVRERLQRINGAVPRERTARAGEIARRSPDRPRLDPRPAEEIIGYGPSGMPA